MHVFNITIVWLLFEVCCPNRECFTHGDVIITNEGCKFWLSLILMAIEQWGFFNVLHLLWQGSSVYNGLSKDPWHPRRYWAFSSWVATTLFNDLDLSRLEFDHMKHTLNFDITHVQLKLLKSNVFETEKR